MFLSRIRCRLLRSDPYFSILDSSSELLKFVAGVDRPDRAGGERHALRVPLLGGLAAAGAGGDEPEGEQRAAVDGREPQGRLKVLGGLDRLMLVIGHDGQPVEILEALMRPALGILRRIGAAEATELAAEVAELPA